MWDLEGGSNKPPETPLDPPLKHPRKQTLELLVYVSESSEIRTQGIDSSPSVHGCLSLFKKIII